MSDLVAFLLARIAEDEAVAVAVRDGFDPFGWTDAEGLPAVGMADSDGPSGYGVVIIDPARVLAECEAKRRIVDLHHPLDGGSPEIYPYVSEFTGRVIYPECGECGRGGEPDCPTLRLLALPYADHPEFQEAWKP